MRGVICVLGLLIVLSAAPTVDGQIYSDCLASGAAISSTLPPISETLNVGVSQTVLDVQVSVDITHTFVGDLELTMTSPGGTNVMMHNNFGGSADNMNLIFSDQGVANGSQPYTCACAMQPAPGSMSSFSGENSAGNWTFVVDDTLGGDDGTLNQWCLSLFDVGPPPPISDLSCVAPPGTDMASVSWINGASYDAIDIFLNGSLEETLAGSATTWTSPVLPTPSTNTIAVVGVIGGDSSGPISCTVEIFMPGTSGPDVIYTDCPSITNWGQVGGIRGYSLGSHTCNIGDMNLDWGGGVTPLLGMNGFRLVDGRLEQIGMSWLKNGTIAAAGAGCGLPCNGQGGGVLGAGCRDVYGASYNGGQSRLGPRSAVNAFTGAYPGAGSTTDSSAIGERLQIHETDLGNPGALYFIEGVYVAPDDAAFGNADNNASYKRVTVNGSFDLSPVGDMQITVPAIQAWQDHGLGVNTPDPSVEIFPADVPNEGRFLVANKVTDLGGGQWRYDYAIYNLSSHRSGGTFSVPLPAGVSVSNTGFHDVDYHSGEPYDNTDWNITVGASSITWSSPQTFAQNANSNALRFGTMYNFYFDANVAPETVTATLGLFRPGTPDSITFDVSGPGGDVIEFVRGDCDADGSYSLPDAVSALVSLFPSGAPVTPPCIDACDHNDDGSFDISDPIGILDDIFVSGTTPSAPFPGCGGDPTNDALDCASFPPCP